MEEKFLPNHFGSKGSTLIAYITESFQNFFVSLIVPIASSYPMQIYSGSST